MSALFAVPEIVGTEPPAQRHPAGNATVRLPVASCVSRMLTVAVFDAVQLLTVNVVIFAVSEHLKVFDKLRSNVAVPAEIVTVVISSRKVLISPDSRPSLAIEVLSRLRLSTRSVFQIDAVIRFPVEREVGVVQAMSQNPKPVV